MRFKDWFQLEYSGGTAVADMLSGGRTELPVANNNANLTGVQSKYVTKDGSDKLQPDGFAGKIKPDNLFHFKTRRDKNDTKERRSQWIDKNGKRAQFSKIPPDTIY